MFLFSPSTSKPSCQPNRKPYLSGAEVSAYIRNTTTRSLISPATNVIYHSPKQFFWQLFVPSSIHHHAAIENIQEKQIATDMKLKLFFSYLQDAIGNHETVS